MAAPSPTGKHVPREAPTALLPYLAERAMRRLEMALAPQVVVNFDSFGSIWGASPVVEIERDITAARADGVAVDEWVTVDRDGTMLRVVRIADSGLHGGIHAFTIWTGLAEAVAK